MLLLPTALVLALGQTEAVCQFALPGPDRITLIDWDGGMFVSENGGESRLRSDATWLRRMEIVEPDHPWGLYFWRGTHGASAAEVVRSKDGGHGWSSTEIDVESFFPVDLVSDGSAASLIAEDGGARLPRGVVPLESTDILLTGSY